MKAENILRNESKKADKVIKYCKKCNNCWERLLLQIAKESKHRRYILTHQDFPSYGKTKETCPSCLGLTSYTHNVKGFMVQEIIKS